jgi:hypothetical protein
MRKTNVPEVRYGTPTTGKGAASRSRAGRLCEFPGCETILSTYNSATTCWLHSSPTPRHALAPR